MANKSKGYQKKGSKKESRKYTREEKGTRKNRNYEEEACGSANNDLTWYSKNSQLLFDSANINYPFPVGSKIKFDYQDETGNRDAHNLEYYLPGIYQIIWRPSVGISTSEASAVNIAARNVYSYIRQANSGAKNYDSTDLMLYLLAMDSCYAFHAFMIRLYGVIRNTAVTVRYMPEALTRVCGGNYADLTAHLADLRYYINFFGARLGAMAVPNNMYYFTRHRWMSSNVYADEPSAKPQLYVFVPEGFYKFGYDKDKAGKLFYTPLGATPDGRTSEDAKDRGLTFEQLRTYGENLLKQVIGDEDFNIMSGDILKAYSNNIVAIPTITEDYVTGYFYSPEVLEQIHNLQAHNTEWQDGTWDIKQSSTKDFLIFNPACTMKVTVPEVFIDSKADVPTPGDTMILTRLTSMLKPSAQLPDMENELATCGSEVVTNCFEYQYVTSTDTVGLPGTLVGRAMPTLNYVYALPEEATGKVTATPGVWNEMVNGLGVGSCDRSPLRTWIIAMSKAVTQPAGGVKYNG